MARITYIYQRGSIFWWRRRLQNDAGQSFLVALSLGVRDIETAKWIGRRVCVEADALMTAENSLTQQEASDSLKQFILLARLDLHNRAYRDFEQAKQMGADDRAAFLGMRARNNRIFAGLNRIAAAFGPIKQYSKRVDEFLDERGYKWHERDEIARRLENGHAVEAFSSHSGVAGTPAQSAIETEMRSQGFEPTIVNLQGQYQALATARASLEEAAARLNREAINDPAAAQRKLHLRLPITRDFADETGMTPPYAGADAIERGKFACAPNLSDVATNTIQYDFGLGAETPAASPIAPSPENASTPKDGKAVEAPVALQTLAISTPTGGNTLSSPVTHAPDAEEPKALRTTLQLGQIAIETQDSIGPDILTIDDLVTSYIDRMNVKEHKRQRQFRSTALVLAWATEGIAIDSIKFKHLDRWRELLKYLPQSWGKSPKDFEKKFAQVIKDGAERFKRGGDLLPGTINRHVGDLRRLADFAAVKGFKWYAPEGDAVPNLCSYRRRSR